MRSLVLLSFLVFGSASLAQTELADGPSAPPKIDLLSKASVKAKLVEFQKGCETRFSIKACKCLKENFSLKVNGRDIEESDLDMMIALTSKKGLKKYRKVQDFGQYENMIRELEANCVQDPNWKMDMDSND